MIRYIYRCTACQWEEATTEHQGDDLGDCPSPWCGGTLLRVWSVGFIRSSCRAVAK